MPDRELPIPTRAEEFTPAWFTAVLRRAGLDTTVTGARLEPVGTGQMARSARAALTAEPAGSTPTTVVVKYAAADEGSRAAGASGGYRNEVGFYRDLAGGHPSLSTPRCHHAVLSDDGVEFVLVLDDLAPARQGDQIAGCTPDQAAAAVDNLVALHAPRWNDPTLFDLPWVMRRSPEAAEFTQALFADATAKFVERYAGRLTPGQVGILERFAAVTGPWSLGRTERFSVLHGDYRLDNLLFGVDDQGRPTVSAVDWQTVSIDLPAKDLAYLLGNGLLPADRRAHERDLVDRYRAGLLAAGVGDYSAEDCWDDYRWGQFHGLVITVFGAVYVGQTDRGDDMFMAMTERHCAAIAELDAESLLPAAR